MCYIILVTHQYPIASSEADLLGAAGSGFTKFLPVIQANVALLQASVLSFINLGLEVRILYSFHLVQTANLIRLIGHLSREESDKKGIWKKHHWSSRGWLEAREAHMSVF